MTVRTALVILSAAGTMIACGGQGSPSSPSSSHPAGPVTPPGSMLKATIDNTLSGLVGAINSTTAQSQKKGLAVPGLAGFTSQSLFARPDAVTTCNVNTGVCQVNESFDHREACIGGGYSGITSLMTGSINANGGTLSWESYSTLVDCSKDGWVTNSNPYLSAGGTIGVFASRLTINLKMGGGFIVTNAPGTANGRAECHYSGVLLQYDSTTGSWSNSGSVMCTPGGEFKF